MDTVLTPTTSVVSPSHEYRHDTFNPAVGAAFGAANSERGYLNANANTTFLSGQISNQLAFGEIRSLGVQQGLAFATVLASIAELRGVVKDSANASDLANLRSQIDVLNSEKQTAAIIAAMNCSVVK